MQTPDFDKFVFIIRFITVHCCCPYDFTMLHYGYTKATYCAAVVETCAACVLYNKICSITRFVFMKIIIKFS